MYSGVTRELVMSFSLILLTYGGAQQAVGPSTQLAAQFFQRCFFSHRGQIILEDKVAGPHIVQVMALNTNENRCNQYSAHCRTWPMLRWLSRSTCIKVLSRGQRNLPSATNLHSGARHERAPCCHGRGCHVVETYLGYSKAGQTVQLWLAPCQPDWVKQWCFLSVSLIAVVCRAVEHKRRL